jgi:hypothetical protein
MRATIAHCPEIVTQRLCIGIREQAVLNGTVIITPKPAIWRCIARCTIHRHARQLTVPGITPEHSYHLKQCVTHVKQGRHKAEHTAYTDEIVQSPQPRHDNQRQDAILSIVDTDNVSIDRAVGRTKNSMNEWHHPPQTKPNRMRHQHIHGSLDLQLAMNPKIVTLN